MQSLVSVRAAVVLAGVFFVSSGGPRVAAQTAGAAGRGSTATVVVPPGRPTVPLWPNGAPGSEARRNEPEEIQGETIRNVHNPSIVVFLPRKEIRTGVGFVLAPGGGHTSLWIMHEGFNPAQILVEQGQRWDIPIGGRTVAEELEYMGEEEAEFEAADRYVRWAAETGVTHLATADDHELTDPEISDDADFEYVIVDGTIVRATSTPRFPNPPVTR